MTTTHALSAPFLPGTSALFDDADAALERVAEIYKANTAWLRERLLAYVNGEEMHDRVRACYPYVQITATTGAPKDRHLSYGFVAHPGAYRITLTQPEIFHSYLRTQFSLLLMNHRAPLEIGVSETPIPIHFALDDETYEADAEMSGARLNHLGDIFDLPSLSMTDDAIVNGTFVPKPGEPLPLGFFAAPRVDLSLQRLRHYTATSAEHFQNLVLFTNYQFYVDEFVRLGHELMSLGETPQEKAARSQYDAFVEPGDVITPNQNRSGDEEVEISGVRPVRLPQMPAYHLKREDGSGITLVNIGVGPSNAKTITDHIAVLRPHAWVMLGHCAGLRNSQTVGDYVLAHAYVREDHVLDGDLPLWVPVPALAEVQQALELAVSRVTGITGHELKRIMRTGTVATIDDRNWELRDHREPMRRFSQSRAIALDMESATIAANGYRFRVPYGTLLCVSDKPLHGELKLPGMADKFYRERVGQHLKIGVLAMEILREHWLEWIHSRKLRSFSEVAFR